MTNVRWLSPSGKSVRCAGSRRSPSARTGPASISSPYPTPLLDEHGNVVGAVNMLVDVSGLKQADYLCSQAARCRRLARSVDDERTVTTLTLMAGEYEEQAEALLQPN